MLVPKEDSIASKDFYQKVSFYFIRTANFQCMSELPSNTNIC